MCVRGRGGTYDSFVCVFIRVYADSFFSTATHKDKREKRHQHRIFKLSVGVDAENENDDTRSLHAHISLFPCMHFRLSNKEMKKVAKVK